MNPELRDSRRLTGANLHWGRPSAILDVAIDGPGEDLVGAWEQAARSWLEAVGRAEEQTCFHRRALFHV